MHFTGVYSLHLYPLFFSFCSRSYNVLWPYIYCKCSQNLISDTCLQDILSIYLFITELPCHLHILYIGVSFDFIKKKDTQNLSMVFYSWCTKTFCVQIFVYFAWTFIIKRGHSCLRRLKRLKIYDCCTMNILCTYWLGVLVCECFASVSVFYSFSYCIDK